MYQPKLDEPTAAYGRTRWLQLVIGVLCMALIANLQYGWTLFVRPMHDTMGWPEHDIQAAFTIFIIIETWLGPFAGMFVDRYGPRPVVAVGAVLVFIAWTLNAHAHTLPVLYTAAVISGLGAGSVYGTCVGNALKWFPEKRGFASGLTATGFGVGAALTVVPIANAIKVYGYQSAFSTFAMILGGAILFLSLFLVRPRPGLRVRKPSRARVEARRDLTTVQTLRTPVFWVMYVIFVAVSTGGLIATAQLGPMARDFGVARLPMAFFGATIPLLSLTLSIDNLANGLTRPLGGFLSDRFGRENVMFIVFLGEGAALLGLAQFGHTPLGFVLFAPLIFLCWGETYAISSALAGDTFGDKHVTANAGALYTTKGVAALLVPLGSVIKETSGTWTTVLFCCAAVAIATALASKFVLSPMRRAFVERGNLLDDMGQTDSGLTHVSPSPHADPAH
ncbi:oxalate/formate MFS antiporter [Paraburkholderia caballeronis]|uniref:MFS transporter, OFA family, oxalate/formate antiporter n=1 Tax=Paraburkholderia caballeronis TaxID=416943 RepID=A0A1H7LZN1_9BURK|nr:oxalate/formate MFS antiporter [Paraburkholderia caballeronis]PXW28643.1 OFA family oxalate/formate antiporter-like MFS transporter [Paraburkholderia caballeronis]PXX04009.1 OFA family oxalate/formate antiporter-like MFS transporter [Paraburkholderia caballeronis]RAK04753.1 OFA family oxalate/formate antiporter-like MFS transporter [Paraburkholderia caballeronis]SED66682.1 MFS transporter, OFA family, oxalate/formate antiporter [Paraburkholderia caballeronis]SEL03767.1 MFS transporter, OFA 